MTKEERAVEKAKKAAEKEQKRLEKEAAAAEKARIKAEKEEAKRLQEAQRIAKRANAPKLFGIMDENKTSRDFYDEDSWGKNQFNSSFPVALISYMSKKGLNLNYIKMTLDTEGSLGHKVSSISATDLLGIDPLSDNARFLFEDHYPPFKKFYKSKEGLSAAEIKKDHGEKIDVVTIDASKDKTDDSRYLSALEIKLTTLPDSSTITREDPAKYSCEVVVRPPTICFIACSICQHYEAIGRDKLAKLFNDGGVKSTLRADDNESTILAEYPKIKMVVINILKDMVESQAPIVVEPIWRTNSSGVPDDNFLDVFVWSNLALINLCLECEEAGKSLSRPMRMITWIYFMLKEYATGCHEFFYKDVVTAGKSEGKNDKAFSVNGGRTFDYLNCPNLVKPRIKLSQVKEIISGPDFLKPERRLDNTLVLYKDLFF